MVKLMNKLIKLLTDSFPHLSPDLILDRSSAEFSFNKNTISSHPVLCASISLTEPQDIKSLIKLAIAHDFSIQPIGSGKNWGYGSVGHGDNRDVVVLDLSHMNKIVAVDKDLGLVNIGPGVTQQQLYNFLEENGWEYMCPATGAGPTVSVLANAIERGYGLTPHVDHFMAVNALRGIIPNPELWGADEKDYIYHSAIKGLDMSDEKFVDDTFKWGLGPYMEGLFTQSSFAIITEGTIRLAKKPKNFTSFAIKVNDHSKLDDALDFIRETLSEFEGVVPAINLMDKRRLIAMNGENPNGPDNQKLLSEEQIKSLTKKNLLPEWVIVGSIYGNECVVDVVKKRIKKLSRPLGLILFSNSLLFKIGDMVSSAFPFGLLKTLRHNIENVKEGNRIMLGIPRQMALPLAYWKNANMSPDLNRELNPSKDDCGLLWYAPLVPMKNHKVNEYINFIRRVTSKHKVEPLITLTVLHYDCIDSTIPILFNKNDPESVEAAKACIDELFEEGRKLGFVPYRLNIDQQIEKLDPNHIHWKTCSLIKSALDPHNVISPNRYNPGNGNLQGDKKVNIA